ncbi:tyrosinase family protein [Rhodococcus sp. NPDC003318]|uniref:tyrosinase family protein n=1 Tax=Rhodococcus sp. NPDC003318 TaxID=3364503 RepID=UPI0036875797
MTTAYVRQNIWTLDQQDHRHPTIEAYARAVAVLQQRSRSDVDDPRGWTHLAAVHGTGNNTDKFRNQCQHQSWYFLPWHRMYLYWFERIVRAAVRELPDVDDTTKQTWALPFWEYGPTVESRRLPRAFLDPFLRDGVTPNPLRVPGRNLNSGAALPPNAARLQEALAPVTFTGSLGFGGAATAWNHFGEDPAAAAAPLELTPHGAVHVQVGGPMADFDTAGLDPIFWLHHANIDRLWEVWLGQPNRTNTTSSAWLTGETFHFHDETGTPRSQQVADVLDIRGQLNYRYEGTPAPSVPIEEGPIEEAHRVEHEPAHPPELVGATSEAVTLTGDVASVAVDVGAPAGPLAESARVPSRVFLDIEDVSAPRAPGVTYSVYADIPDGDPATDDDHFVGTASFFGIEEVDSRDSEHAGMRLRFDITDLHRRLVETGRWSDRVSVTFVPDFVEPPDSPLDLPAEESATVQDPGTLRVGRIGVFYQ